MGAARKKWEGATCGHCAEPLPEPRTFVQLKTALGPALGVFCAKTPCQTVAHGVRFTRVLSLHDGGKA